MADQALVTVGVVEEDVVTNAFNVIGKGGTVVITGLANPEKLTVHVSGGVMTLFEKTIKETLFGSANPQYDIVKLLRGEGRGQRAEVVVDSGRARRGCAVRPARGCAGCGGPGLAGEAA
jgi:Zn-dependent alcohol dehydrogenase